MIGAPVDYILLNDLEKAKSYKMYIFLNAFYLTEQQTAIIKKTARPRRTINSLDVCTRVFSGTSSCLNDASPLPDSNWILDAEPRRLEVNNYPGDGRELFIRSFRIQQHMEQKMKLDLSFYGNDSSSAIVLGTLKINGNRINNKE